MTININVSNDTISGSYGKEQFVVKFDKKRYDAMVKLQEKAAKVKKFDDLKPIFADFEKLTTQSFKELVETKCPYIVINESSKKFYLKNDGVTSSIAMPEVLAKRIIESAEKGVDFMPLVKLWTRWLRNPVLRGKDKKGREAFSIMFANYVNTDYVNRVKMNKLIEEGLAYDVAQRYASVKDVSITQEGLLCTYKAAQEVMTKYALDADGNKITVDRYQKTIDENTGVVLTTKPDIAEDRLFYPPVMGETGGDAFFCEGANGFTVEGHFIKVGCVIRLRDWSMVDCNSDRSCVKGLHVGGLTYIAGYQSSGTETFNCFVDPMHIGAFDHSGNGAIRCIQYFTHSALDMVNGSMYHSSTYAAHTDEQWAKMRAEVVEFFSKKRKDEVEKQDTEIDEINSI